MGVPKFYRWISERYPCLSEVVKEHQIPEFDNLYLDMNGIIHQCSGRRFRSAKEAEDKIKKALEKGEVLPTEARFDSNCITPGIDFMARLQEQLKYFVNNKISTDTLWHNVRVYLSGHETPGEGEHKIMEFIRSENATPEHNPNTRHCLYGLDADLMMLGLTSHEPNFSLLREEVRFGGKKSQKRITAPEETTFHLLHLSLMREYIDYEFSSLRNHIGSDYDLERIIDDWILMGFLVGNDFIPHLPHLHINHDALPLLYKTYITVLPSLGGYLNENGHLNLRTFEKYLEKLAEFDREHFNDVFVDLKWFESKVGNKYLNEAAGLAAEKEAACKGANKSQDSSLGLAALTPSDGVTGKGKGTVGDDDEEEEDDMFETEFRQYKRTYYMTKMGVDVVSDEFLARQAKCYVEGIQWILHYYYHGVQSWSWYYPYHYAPFLSDIRNIAGLKLTFDLGKPFMPFQQLLAVLPAASKELLPTSYRPLMTSEISPIIEYYPLDFKTDLNGKQQEWEAVVLIPFIDERCLLAAMEPCNHKLTKEEKARNCHTECEKTHTDIHTLILREPNLRLDRSALYFCGFPTLQHIKHKYFKRKSGVVVFQQSSRGENMMLEILPSEEGEMLCDDVAAQVLGKSVFVNWPHLEESRIIAVSDGETKFSLEEPPGVQRVYDSPSTPPPTRVVCLSDKEQKDWVKDVQGITEHFLKRKGIMVNETEVVLYGQLLTGRKYVPKANGAVELEKQWAKQVLPFAFQTVVKDIEAFYSSLTCFKSLDELFPQATTVFMVGNPYYGAMGEVQDSSDVIKDGRVRVVFNVPHEPQLEPLIQNQHKYCVRYSPGYVLASRLGTTSYLVSRFSGSIFIGRGSKRNPCGEQKANVGLNLKFNKKNEEVPGYTKRTEKEWVYSAAVEELLGEYLDRFPEVFNTVSRNSHDDVFYEDDIWPGVDQNGAEKVAEITSWLKGHPVSSISRASCDLQVLDSAIVERIEDAVEKAKVKKSTKKVRVTVKPHLLFRPLEQQQGVVPDPDAEYRLFDRVVNIRESFTVPLGLRGTVVGIKGAEREAEVLYEVLFDEDFAGGLNVRSSSPRGYRVPPCALINLSHGGRADHTSHKLTAIVKPQPVAGANFHSQRQLAGLNHSPRSPFIPMQVSGEQCSHSLFPVWNKKISHPSFQFTGLQTKVFCSMFFNHDFIHLHPPFPFPLAAKMNAPQGDTGSPAPATSSNLTNAVLTSKVSELACVCVGLGMAPPDFSFIGNRQGLVVCQVKLSNGLMVHGPQCQSENDAKEKAAFFALQRLNSLGSGFPLPPPLAFYFSPGGLLLPPQGYAPAHMWGMPLPPHHQGQSFYGAPGTFPGAARPQPAATAPPIGSHNQFIPLQVTKKRVSANKKNQDTREFYSAAHTVARNQSHKAHLTEAVSTTTAAPHTPPRQNVPATGHTPGSASKRRHRKLAVNFEAAKVSE
uniref:5'-3' exoribonuclease 1 n=1 Tax=Scophthalmus maximus TaxID=52904 RepID=A0A8D3DYQ6_SCOMX